MAAKNPLKMTCAMRPQKGPEEAALQGVTANTKTCMQGLAEPECSDGQSRAAWDEGETGQGEPRKLQERHTEVKYLAASHKASKGNSLDNKPALLNPIWFGFLKIQHKQGERWGRMTEGVNLVNIRYKHICKCHNESSLYNLMYGKKKCFFKKHTITGFLF
jgi:hypothetical protein